MAKQVKLVKSLIGYKKDQIATANALGLYKIGDVSVQQDNPRLRARSERSLSCSK